MAQHCLRIFVTLTSYLSNIIGYGNVVDAYTHADAECGPIYIIVNEV
jgi:hypothetical protein